MVFLLSSRGMLGFLGGTTGGVCGWDRREWRCCGRRGAHLESDRCPLLSVPFISSSRLCSGGEKGRAKVRLCTIHDNVVDPSPASGDLDRDEEEEKKKVVMISTGSPNATKLPSPVRMIVGETKSTQKNGPWKPKIVEGGPKN